MSAAAWMSETWRTYVGNATSVRDFRVQMRGFKTVAAWSLYLFILLTVGYFAYAEVGSNPNMSVAEAQSRLNSFFGTIVRVVAGAVMFMAPGLTAAGIVGERQRRSFDLVFSAPVTPKYFLVGKMLASYRYTLMILVLAVPVVSISAMVGGATWGDILITFLMLSMSGLMMTAIALLVSSVQEKVQGAIAASYMIVIAFIIVTSYLSGWMLFARSAMSGPIQEVSFLATINPFFVPESYGTFSMIAGRQIPNWVLSTLFTLVIVRFCVLGAGSALSTYGSWETRSLRLQGLVYVFLLSWITVLSLSLGSSFSAAGASTDPKSITGALGLLVLFVPGIAAAGMNGRRINELDGLFRFRKVLLGTPAGAAPYLLTLLAALSAGGYVGARQQGIPLADLGGILAHASGVILFTAGLTRFLCWRFGLQNGRRWATMLTVLAVWLSPLFLSFPIMSNASSMSASPGDNLYWLIWPLWPLAMNYSNSGLVLYGGLMAAFGTCLFLFSTRAMRLARAR